MNRSCNVVYALFLSHPYSVAVTSAGRIRSFSLLSKLQWLPLDCLLNILYLQTMKNVFGFGPFVSLVCSADVRLLSFSISRSSHRKLHDLLVHIDVFRTLFYVRVDPLITICCTSHEYVADNGPVLTVLYS